MISTSSVAAVETFEIEGLITPASPEALTTELESQLGVKVVNLDLKNTLTGWPLLSVEFASSTRSDLSSETTDHMLFALLFSFLFDFLLFFAFFELDFEDALKLKTKQ